MVYALSSPPYFTKRITVLVISPPVLVLPIFTPGVPFSINLLCSITYSFVFSISDRNPFMSLESSSSFSTEDVAKWNTSVRLLSSLLRDHMVVATPTESPLGDGRPGLTIHGRTDAGRASVPPAVWVGLTKTGVLRLINHKALTKSYPAFPGDLAPPTVVTTSRAVVSKKAPSLQATQELDPARLLRHLRPVLDPQPIDDSDFNEICNELTNSAQNGRYWIEWYKKNSKPLSIKSSMMEWEQALYTGHPLHPVQYSFFGNSSQ